MRDAEKPSMDVLDGTATAEQHDTEKAAETSYNHAHAIKPLQARHLFRFAIILNKVGIRQFRDVFDGQAVVDSVKGGASVEDVGVQVVFAALEIVIANLPKVEGDIYGLVADLADMTADEVAELPLGEFTAMLVDVFKADGFRDFFTQAQRLLS